MSFKIKNLPDFMSGLIFTSLGLVVMWAAGEYRLGSAASMGPGYFPRMLGAVLALLGLIVLAQSFGQEQSAPSESAEPYPHHSAFPLRGVIMASIGCAVFWILAGVFGKTGWTGLDIPVVIMLVIAWFASRELFWVLAAIAAFALSLMHVGLVVATAVLLALAHFGSLESKWLETVINYFVLLCLCLVVFVYGLRLQFPVLPDAVNTFLRAY
jgi:hypothetical protein